MVEGGVRGRLKVTGRCTKRNKNSWTNYVSNSALFFFLKKRNTVLAWHGQLRDSAEVRLCPITFRLRAFNWQCWD